MKNNTVRRIVPFMLAVGTILSACSRYPVTAVYTEEDAARDAAAAAKEIVIDTENLGMDEMEGVLVDGVVVYVGEARSE